MKPNEPFHTLTKKTQGVRTIASIRLIPDGLYQERNTSLQPGRDPVLKWQNRIEQNHASTDSNQDAGNPKRILSTPNGPNRKLKELIRRA
jgi:hypothetical protein